MRTPKHAGRIARSVILVAGLATAAVCGVHASPAPLPNGSSVLHQPRSSDQAAAIQWLKDSGATTIKVIDAPKGTVLSTEHVQQVRYLGD